MNPPIDAGTQTRAAAYRPRALSLELTKGCNLRCGYCYYAARTDAYDPGTMMSPETAERSVDLLLEEGPADQPLHLHLFGGEPLLNLPLLRHVVEYAERRGAAAGRTFTFEVTTNGTRFTPEAIGFLNDHGIRVGVSFDGPPDVQDAARPLAAGSSHAAAEPGIRRFLASRRGTPLMAGTHATIVVTRREPDLLRLVSHLEGLGFQNIILAPATEKAGGAFGFREEDLPDLLFQYDRLAADCEQRKREGRPVTVTWYGTLLGRLLSGERTTVPCQGGRDYLGVDASGNVALCYRFYEDPDHAMGDVRSGIDRTVTERILEHPLEERPACSRCWARWFCGGGCHHDNLVATGGLGDPNPVTCSILRHGMDRTLAMWARLSREGHLSRQLGTPEREEPLMEQPASPGPDTRPRAKETCHVRDADGETVVYAPDTHEVAVLNETASFIFGLCDGQHTTADIAGALAGSFDAPRDVLERDLAQTLELLRRKGFLD